MWWPSALLLGCSVLYGTNFPLGRIMNEALPPAATTSARFVMASIALFPFLLRLAPSLRLRGIACGAFTALGYISQSISLNDTPAAKVAFLGALIVIVCPALEAVFDGRKMSPTDAPQTWLAAALALAGVAFLELESGPEVVETAGAAAGSLSAMWASATASVGWGDLWAVLQAVGFGTSFYLTEKMMAREPSQALSITAAQVSTVALFSAVWALWDGTGDGGWLLEESTRATYALPGLLLAPQMRTVALAATWTGLITTAANRFAETKALGKMSSSQASVLLATEPLWAALFGATLIGESLGMNDGIGGALIVLACVVNSADEGWAQQQAAQLFGGAAGEADAAPADADANDVADVAQGDDVTSAIAAAVSKVRADAAKEAGK